ncbi:MAG: hypothetical protein WCR07_16420 [Verrucomicrobiota bacterium]|jgi:hypothetical protein
MLQAASPHAAARMLRKGGRTSRPLTSNLKTTPGNGITQADRHPNSDAYRPRRGAHDAMDAMDAMDAIKQGPLTGCTDVIDADLSG